MLLLQGDRTPRTPFARIHEWLNVAEGFTFGDDPEVGHPGHAPQGHAPHTVVAATQPVSAWVSTLLPPLVLPRLRLQKQAAFAAFDFGQLRAEVRAVEAAAAALQSPTVFCHNDLLSGKATWCCCAPWLTCWPCCLWVAAGGSAG